MDTRGFVSFAVDGETKTAYIHHDSYPDCLGLNILGWARSADLHAAAIAARALRVVSDSDTPTQTDVERLAPFTNRNVGGAGGPTWYQLLRETQGDCAAMLAAGAIEDASEFPADSLCAEWGYVVDFDAQALEVYVGFQKEPHSDGRFAALAGRDGYAPVRLVASWSLADLPSDPAFLAAAEAGERDDD
jgi:hypothetical protein